MRLCLVRHVIYHEVTESGFLCGVIGTTEDGVTVRDTGWFEIPPQEGGWSWLFPDPGSEGDPYTFNLDEVPG